MPSNNAAVGPLGYQLIPSSKGLRLDSAWEAAPSDIVVLSNVQKTYLLGVEGVPALRGVDFTVKKGEFVCILGKSGSGKSTMLSIIGTIDKPTRGDLSLCGGFSVLAPVALTASD